jgi:AcrR family transcriptional regulator
MPRSGEDARRRLHQAALELVGRQGYDATTAAQIAAVAGVTERTFFRHFADKREALFGQEETLRIALTDAIQAAADGLGPMDVLLHAFRSVEPMLVKNRPLTEPLQKVIAQTPALQERVLTKTAGLVDALDQALRRRGVADGLAALAAQVGMAAFSFAARAWTADPAPGLDAHLVRAFEELQNLSAASAGQ